MPTLSRALAPALLLTLVVNLPAQQVPAGWQTGGQVAPPYTQDDVTYGRKLQAKIDKARDDSRGAVSTMPATPFHVIGDVYDIGVHNWNVYVVKTPEGDIMLDTGWPYTAEIIEREMNSIGIKTTDIKIILTTEWHGDHNGGVAYFQKKSGAKLMVMAEDVADISAGKAFPAGHVDRILHDRDTVTLGGKTLTAYHIPGHTPGSTTWYWQETEAGKTYNVADVCCWFTPDNVVSDSQYPTKTLENNWAVLKSLPVDIPLPGIHSYHFDTMGKLARIKAGEQNVWLDPQGYRGIIASFEQDLKDKVIAQQKSGPPPPRTGGPGPRPAKPFAVKNVRVYDGTTVTEGSTIVVANGKIAAVGVNAEIPAGYDIVDGTGKTIMPGLIDAHVHMADSFFTAGAMPLEEAMIYGITTVMDMASSNPDDFQVAKKWVKANSFNTAADIFTAGPAATVAGGHGDMQHKNPTLTSPSEAQAWVDQRKATGSDYIKLMSETFEEHNRKVPTLTDEEFSAVVTAAHKDGLLAVAHTLQEKRARTAITAGVDGLVHISPYDPPTPDFGTFAAAHHIFYSTNLISYAPTSYKISLASDPYLAPWMPPFMIDGLKTATLFPDSKHEYSIAGLKELIAAGVPILAGTDIGYPYAPLLHAELEIMVKDGGMTPLQALASVTSNTAKAYKLTDRGTIQPGMRADLLMLNGDPTKDILQTRNIAAIWRQGTKIDRDSLKVEVTTLPTPPRMGPPPGAGGPPPPPKPPETK